MKIILFVGLFLPLVAQAVPERMICELELQSRDALIAASRRFDQAITGHRFRVVTYATMPALLKIFELPAETNLTAVTMDFSPTVDGYKMTINGPQNESVANIEFDAPPLLTWTRVNSERRKLTKYYEYAEDPFVDDSIVASGIAYGTILAPGKQARTYLEFHNLEGGIVAIDIGVDLPSDVKLDGTGPERSLLLRHPGGWYRRTHIMTLGYDTPQLRQYLKMNIHH